MAELDEVISVIGFGRAQLWILLFSGLSILVVFCETMGMAIIGPASQCDLETLNKDLSSITAAGFMGIIVAAYFSGYICDIAGRRKVLLYSLALSCTISQVSMLVTRYKPFLILRFLTGIFIACPAFVTITYLSEFCTAKVAPVVINYMSMLVGIGMIYCPGLAELVLDFDWRVHILDSLEYCPWRFLGFLFTLPGIMATLLLLTLPESPNFLFMQGLNAEADATLQWMAMKNKGKTLMELEVISMVAFPVDAVNGDFHWSHLLGSMWRDTHPIFQKPYVRHFLLSCAGMFCLFAVASGMGVWFTEMRNRFDSNNLDFVDDTVCQSMGEYIEEDVEPDTFICSDSFNGFRDSIILGVTYLIVFNMMGVCLMRFSRKTIFIMTLLTSAACGFSLFWVTNASLIVLVFVMFLALPGVAINLLAGALVGFMPTRYRGKAVCICMLVGRLGAVAGTSMMGQLLETNCVLVFILFPLFSLSSAMLAVFLQM